MEVKKIYKRILDPSSDLYYLEASITIRTMHDLSCLFLT